MQRAAALKASHPAPHGANAIAASDAQERLLCERVTGFLAPIVWHSLQGGSPSRRLLDHAQSGWRNVSAALKKGSPWGNIASSALEVNRTLPPGQLFTGPAAAVALHALMTTQQTVPSALWTPWKAVLRLAADEVGRTSGTTGAASVAVVTPPLPPDVCSTSLEGVRSTAYTQRMDMCWGHAAICDAGEAAFNSTMQMAITAAYDTQLAAMQALVATHADAAVKAAQDAIGALDAGLSPAARSAAVQSASVDAGAGLDSQTAVYRNTSAVRVAHGRLDDAVKQAQERLETAAKEFEARQLSSAQKEAMEAANGAVHQCSGAGTRLPLGKSALTACGVSGGAAARKAVLDAVAKHLPWLAGTPTLERALARAQAAGDDAAARLAAANDAAAAAMLAAGVANATKALHEDMVFVKVPLPGTAATNVSAALTASAAARLRASVARIADIELVVRAGGGMPALEEGAAGERKELSLRNGLAWLEQPLLASVKNIALAELRARSCHGRLRSFPPRPVHTLVACTRAVHAQWMPARGPAFAEGIMAATLARAKATMALPDGLDAGAVDDTALAFGLACPEAQAHLAAARGAGERAMRTALVLSIAAIIHLFGASGVVDSVAGGAAALGQLWRRILAAFMAFIREQEARAAERAAVAAAEAEKRREASLAGLAAKAKALAASKSAPPQAPVTPKQAPPAAWRAVSAPDGAQIEAPMPAPLAELPQAPTIEFVAILLSTAAAGDEDSIRMMRQLPGPERAIALKGRPSDVAKFHIAVLRYATGSELAQLRGVPWSTAPYEEFALQAYQRRPIEEEEPEGAAQQLRSTKSLSSKSAFAL